MPIRKPINLRKAPTLRKGRSTHSKRVTDRINAAGDLIGSIRSLKEKAAAGFGEKLAPELGQGEEMPDQTLALELAGRSVKTAIDLLEKADNVYCKNRRSVDFCRLTASSWPAGGCRRNLEVAVAAS